jgi:hypothetical protein
MRSAAARASTTFILGVTAISLWGQPGIAASGAARSESQQAGVRITPSHTTADASPTSAGRPSADAWDDPPVNADDFSTVAPAVEEYAHGHAQATRRKASKRPKGASSRSAHRRLPGLREHDARQPSVRRAWAG